MAKSFSYLVALGLIALHNCCGMAQSCPPTGSLTLPHEDCTKYIVCDNGLEVVLQCPETLYFNPITSLCDFPRNVEECVGGTRPPGTQPPGTTPGPTVEITPTYVPTTELPVSTEAPSTTPQPTTTQAPTTTVLPTTTEAPTTTGRPSTPEPTTRGSTTEVWSTTRAPPSSTAIPSTTTEILSTDQPVSTLQPSTSRPNRCPPEGVDKIPSLESCSEYILCANGVAIDEECADGLWFNPELKECDFPEHVNCTVTQPPTSTPTPLPECPSEGVIKLPYPGNCSLYIICVEGFPVIQNCVSGTCFDPVDLQCKANQTLEYPHSQEKPTSHSRCSGTSGSSLFVPRPGSCIQFDYCIDNQYASTFTCAFGHKFDFGEQKCIPDSERSCV